MAKQVSLLFSGICEKDAEPWGRQSPSLGVLVSMGGGHDVTGCCDKVESLMSTRSTRLRKVKPIMSLPSSCSLMCGVVVSCDGSNANRAGVHDSTLVQNGA